MQLRDRFSNNLLGGTFNVNGMLGGEAVQLIDQNDGTFIAHVGARVAGEALLEILVGGVDIKDTPIYGIRVVAAVASAQGTACYIPHEIMAGVVRSGRSLSVENDNLGRTK